MDLRRETDQTLITKTITLVREERELLTAILHHLREIDRRRLYSSLQYKSLFDFTVRHLGYAEDQAYRRINAMKLLCELPELEEKINAGDLSLSHINLAQRLFRSEKKLTNESLTREKKVEVLNQIAKKPVREAERITLGMSSAPVELKPDKIRDVTEEKVEIKFTAKASTKLKIEKLKGMLAHKHPNLSLGELMEMLCDLGIEQWDPSKKTAAFKKRCGRKGPQEARVARVAREKISAEISPNISTAQIDGKRADDISLTTTKASHERPSLEKKSAAQVRREVFALAKNACANCGSTFALEVDHIHPRALGGSSAPENLRVLCRSCNQRAAVKVYGIEKMASFLFQSQSQ